MEQGTFSHLLCQNYPNMVSNGLENCSPPTTIMLLDFRCAYNSSVLHHNT